MGKYDNLFSQLTQEKKDELKSNLLRDARALLNDRKITSEMVRDTADWENQGIDKLDTVFVGPFTAKEYLNNIGIDLSKYDEWANKTALIAALAKVTKANLLLLLLKRPKKLLNHQKITAVHIHSLFGTDFVILLVLKPAMHVL